MEKGIHGISNCIWFNPTYAQNADPIAIANEYYYYKEYEKARVEYERLIRNKRNIPLIHDNYVSLLTREKAFDEAEKYVKSLAKSYPDNFTYDIDLGMIYAATGDTLQSEETYNNVIEKITSTSAQENNSNRIRILASVVFMKNLRDHALKTYKWEERQLAEMIYMPLNWPMFIGYSIKKQNMIVEYLNFTRSQPGKYSIT